MTARFRAFFFAGLIIDLLAMASALGGLAAADDTSTPKAILRNYQKAFLDPEAPAGTDVMSHHHHMQDTPVKTAAANPDRKSDVQSLRANSGGRWTTLAPLPSGFNAYHMIMGPGGKILLIAGSGNNADVFAAGTFKSYVWSPTRGVIKTLVTPSDMFCAGHMLMSNGQGLAAGGTVGYSPWKGSRALYTFDFATETFQRQADLAKGRWYPSLINTRGGYGLIVGGFDEKGINSGTSEVYTPATQTHEMVVGTQQFPLYPHIFLTAKAQYFFTGEGWANKSGDTVMHKAGFWLPFNNNKFTAVGGLTKATQRGSGASCWVGDIRDQRLMVMGGGWPTTTSTNLINLKATKPAYKESVPLRASKAYVSCVNLPDGTLLELNGGTANKIENASREVSLLKSASATTWTAMNPLPVGEHRLYHSMAYLLDDGSVISMGSNPKGQTRSNSVLRFEPPYLFKGTRPTLTGLPSVITYGQSYPISTSADVVKVVMMAAASPTHSSDANQRYATVPLSGGKVTINLTSSQFPRGYPRFFAVNSAGAVSNAVWTRLK
jgi:hypothetical protein